VSVPALVAAPMVFVILFAAKILSKFIPLFPTIKSFKYARNEGLYYTLMMSTGLTFGTISALFGLSHGIINAAQYSYIVATVIGSAVVPTMIANSWFLPKHLLPKKTDEEPESGGTVVSIPSASSGD
jgi:glutathione-regulated potassium-efflux system ancillary protein KefC